MSAVAKRAPGATGEARTFFSSGLAAADPAVYAAVTRETGRQRNEIELIASENIVSRAVLEATGSPLTNKYAEGYPGRRYYGGCQHVDEAETLAIERAKQLFDCNFANVQPSSGSQANQAVLLALAQARRHHPRAVAGRRRAPHPRGRAQPVRQVVQGRALRRAPGGPAHRLRRGGQRWPAGTGRASSSPAARPIRASSTSPASAPSPTRSARS